MNPVAFLLQKLLLAGLPSRNKPLSEDGLGGADGSKRGKDFLYIYDTILIFADELESLGAQADELCGPLSWKLIRRAELALDRYCAEETDVSREAALIARSHRTSPPTSKQIVGTCKQGLRTVLGSIFQD